MPCSSSSGATSLAIRLLTVLVIVFLVPGLAAQDASTGAIRGVVLDPEGGDLFRQPRLRWFALPLALNIPLYRMRTDGS
jgi:hypothetical protein